MRSSTLVAAILPVAVTAAPAVDVQERGLLNNVICLTNRILVNGLLLNPAAIPYCAAVAGVPTKTVTNTVTQTPAAATVTVANGASLPPLTITSVLTQTVTTSAHPLSTVTLSCLNSAYKAPTGLNKRALSTVTVPKPTELATVAESLISTLCVCMSLPTQTNTVVSTKTLAPGTVTVTSAAAARATSTVFSTVTVTSTVGGAGAGGASGTAGAASSAATTLIASGLTYKKFTHSFGTGDGNGFTASAFKSKTADWSGVLSYVTFATDNWPATYASPLLTLDRPSAWDASQAAIVFQGFFLAPKTGTYTFASSGNSIDNWGYLWTGDNAFNWNDDNTAFKSTRLDNSVSDGVATVVMNAGDAVPFTYLWANGGAAARSDLTIFGPDGIISDLSHNFVQRCSA